METQKTGQEQKSLQWQTLLAEWKTETKTGRFINRYAKIPRPTLALFGFIFFSLGVIDAVNSDYNSYGLLWLGVFFIYLGQIWYRATTICLVKSFSDWLQLKGINPLNVLKENKEMVKCLNGTGDITLLTPAEKKDAAIFVNATINAVEKEKEKTKFILSVVAIISTAVSGILMGCVFGEFALDLVPFLKRGGTTIGALKLFVKIKLFYVLLAFVAAEEILTRIDPVSNYSKTKTEAWMKGRLKDEY